MNMHNAPNPCPKVGSFTRLLFKIAGVDAETMRLCPERDWDNALAVAGLLIASGVYQAAIFCLAAHQLVSPDRFRPDLLLGAVFLAGFIMLIDSYMIMRSSWHLSGIEQLKRGGLDISGGFSAKLKAFLFIFIRIVLSVALAQLTALFVAFIIYGGDIRAPGEREYRQANAHLMAQAAASVDAGIRRARDAMAAKTAQVATLSTQVAGLRQSEIDPISGNPSVRQAQNEVSRLIAEQAAANDALRDAQKFAADELAGVRGAPGNSGQAGNGPRRRAALEQIDNTRRRAREANDALNVARAHLETVRAQAAPPTEETRHQFQQQRVSFERTLEVETDRLASLKAELDARTANRESDIRAAVENSPEHVPMANGFLTQIGVLERLASENRTTAAIIILIDIVSFGFELAAVLAKVTSYVPTTYAALLASRTYVGAVKIVDSMMEELKSYERRERGEPEILPPPKLVDDSPGASGASRDPFRDLGGGAPNGGSPNGDGPDGGDPDGPKSPPPKRPRGRPRKPRPDI